jgi:hypothetical protein
LTLALWKIRHGLRLQNRTERSQSVLTALIALTRDFDGFSPWEIA